MDTSAVSTRPDGVPHPEAAEGSSLAAAQRRAWPASPRMAIRGLPSEYYYHKWSISFYSTRARHDALHPLLLGRAGWRAESRGIPSPRQKPKRLRFSVSLATRHRSTSEGSFSSGTCCFWHCGCVCILAPVCLARYPNRPTRACCQQQADRWRPDPLFRPQHADTPTGGVFAVRGRSQTPSHGTARRTAGDSRWRFCQTAQPGGDWEATRRWPPPWASAATEERPDHQPAAGGLCGPRRSTKAMIIRNAAAAGPAPFPSARPVGNRAQGEAGLKKSQGSFGA